MLATLVVGLGGTGSWALTHLKQRLLTDQRWGLLGANPGAIGTPGYDTYSGPVVLRALDVDRKNRPRSLEGLVLDPTAEDLAISGPIGRVIEEIQRADESARTWPTIQQWLPRSEALTFELGDATRFMVEGAAIRQFGRVAFFLDQLQGAPQLERVVGALSRLSGADRDGRAQGFDLQVFVVASVAGGAGSGLLVDVLTYLQHARRRLAGEVSTRTVGFVVLPGAFSGVVQGDTVEQMQASGRAALRELDRLINAHRTVRVEWLPGRPVTLDAPALDICYLLDGSRDLSREAPQLEGHVPFENGLPVAIADAIYAHAFPSSGAVFSRDYPNLLPHLIAGTEARYSSFGSYSVNYAWEPLTRSAGMRAAVDMLDHLLAGRESEGAKALGQFLGAGATGSLAVGDVQQPLPAFPTGALSQPQDAGSLLPVSSWLEPRNRPAPAPTQPNLFNHFPGLGKLRTEYDNPDVIKQTQVLIGKFWGSRDGSWNGTAEPGFHEAANHNLAQSHREWERALYVAAVALLNGADRVGGLSAARALLLSLIARVQEFSHQLGALPALDLASYQQAVTDGENAMNDARRWDDMIEQRDYLEARQDLLEQEITAELRTRVSELAGRYLASTREVLAVVDSWRGTLEVVREHAIAGRNAVDAARRAADASPVQRYLPLPGDAVEQELWQDCYGTPGEGLAAGLRQCLETVSWSLTLEEAPPKKIRFATPAQQNRDGGMSLEAALGVTARPFASLRTRSVWEMLERAGTDAGELVAELASRGSPLSVFNPNGQQDVAGNLRQFRDSNYVFTGWLEERADAAESVRGAALSRAVRARLGEREVHTEPLDTLRNPASLPTQDKILVFSARHLVALEAFPAVSILDAEYNRRRGHIPSAHVLPEEKGAALLESASIDLARAGHLTRPLDRVDTDQVALCADVHLLQYLAACVASGCVRWQVNDPVEHTGSWLLVIGDSAVALGTAGPFTDTLSRLTAADDHGSTAAKAALRRTGAELARTAPGRDALAQLARDGWSSEGQVAPGLVEVLKVAAALTVA